MNKKLYALFAFLLCTVIVFTACGDDEDDTALMEWKAYNDQLLKDAVATGQYSKLDSYSKNGSIYWKESNTIKSLPTTKITQDGTPQFTDTVVCRYTGWYFDLNGKKITFDTTEGSANSQAGRTFLMTGLNSSGTYVGVLDGWSTMLQQMHEGQEREFFMPYTLGYGVGGNSSIPGYTTLWFTMKLLKIKPVNPGEFTQK